MKNIIRIDESTLVRLIKESIRQNREWEEHAEDICPRLQKLIKQFGNIVQVNLPAFITPKDVKNENIIKLSDNPSPKEKFNIKLWTGNEFDPPIYAIISPDTPRVKKLANPRFKSLAQLQDFVQEKYGVRVNYNSTKTLSGRNYNSHAFVLDDVSDEVLDKITDLLGDFGFRYIDKKDEYYPHGYWTRKQYDEKHF